MKILLISYYWPPSGGAGVQRWLYFGRELERLGHKLTVVIPKNPTYPVQDHSLIELVKGIEVVEVPIIEPYSWARKFSKGKSDSMAAGVFSQQKKQTWKEKAMLWVRGNLFIPDARKFWKKPVVRKVTELVKENQYQVMITNGPPHSVHLIGLALKQKLGLQWMADFRDPWVEMVYHDELYFSNYAKRKHRRLEAKVLNEADVVTVTSFSTQRDFQKLTPKPVFCLTNGYSEEVVTTKMPNPNHFTVAHIGLMMTSRNPKNLWQALKELTDESSEFKEKLKIELTGTVSPEVQESLAEIGLECFVKTRNYVPHQKAMELQREANLLLLIQANEANTKAALPGKLFEYLKADRPILAIGPEEWDAFEIIDKTKSGIGLAYEQSVEDYKKAIRQIYQTPDWTSDAETVAKYSRREVTKELASIIQNLK